MRALTLHRPWPWAIFGLPRGARKEIENRDWRLPPALLGETVAIHAGQSWDDGAEALVRRLFAGRYSVPPPEQCPTGIVGLVTLSGCLHIDGMERMTDPWFFGEWGFVLSEIVALKKPVPCSGAQKFWTVPSDVEERVLLQLAAQ